MCLLVSDAGVLRTAFPPRGERSVDTPPPLRGPFSESTYEDDCEEDEDDDDEEDDDEAEDDDDEEDDDEDDDDGDDEEEDEDHEKASASPLPTPKRSVEDEELQLLQHLSTTNTDAMSRLEALETVLACAQRHALPCPLLPTHTSKLFDHLAALLGTFNAREWMITHKALQLLRASIWYLLKCADDVASSAKPALQKAAVVDVLFGRVLDGIVRALFHDRGSIRIAAAECLMDLMACPAYTKPHTVIDRMQRLCFRSTTIAGRLHGAETVALWLTTVAHHESKSSVSRPGSASSVGSTSSLTGRFPIERIDIQALRNAISPLEGDAVGTVQAAARKVVRLCCHSPTDHVDADSTLLFQFSFSLFCF